MLYLGLPLPTSSNTNNRVSEPNNLQHYNIHVHVCTANLLQLIQNKKWEGGLWHYIHSHMDGTIEMQSIRHDVLDLYTNQCVMYVHVYNVMLALTHASKDCHNIITSLLKKAIFA